MRIGTFNLENLDETKEGAKPSLADRIAILRPQLVRLKANIICFQEIHGQERPRKKRDVLALKELLRGTVYENFHLVNTRTTGGEAYNKRNLVTVSEYPILESKSINRDLLTNKLQYNLLTDKLDKVKQIRWERPLLYTKLEISPGDHLHLINVHFKSRNPTSIPVQQVNFFTWKTVTGWAEGYFLSSMKRVGQALEARVLVDRIFDDDPSAKIVMCGDFNAHAGEVPVEAIAGRIENTGNAELINRVMFPCEDSIPESMRFSHIHHGKGNLLDHMLMSRSMLSSYRGAEIHNEGLHDESVAFAFEKKFPESDHAPFIAEFELQ